MRTVSGVSNRANRFLIIFGLRGTLMERLSHSELPAQPPRASLQFAKYHVWLRPGATEALQELSTFADIAIWSATPHRNTVPLVQLAFTDLKFEFIWHRDHTVPDTFRRRVGGVSEKVDAYAVMKDLGRVYRDNPAYAPERTLVVDDTPYKCRGHAGNILLVPTFDIGSLMREAAGHEDKVLPQVVDFVRDLHERNIQDVRSILPKRIFSSLSS